MAEMNERMGSDERLKKSSGGISRESRSSSDSQRVEQDGTALSVRERIRSLRGDIGQEILPTVPKQDGWHFCWLSSTSTVDPIHVRMSKFGYEPVKASDVPGFDNYLITSGTFEGCIACNEMVLFRVPEEIYQELMLINHHEKPLDSELGIRQQVEKTQTDRNGRSLGSVEGFDTLGRSVKTPTF